MGEQAMRKKQITFQFEFFKSQDPEQLEQVFRRLVKQRRFPAFSKCLPMVHYKNLKQRDLREEFPLMVNENDLKHKTES
jgi:hypothetical protein